MKRNYFVDHYNNYCLINCPYGCDKKMKRTELKNHFENECESVYIHCSRGKCESIFQRRDIDKHDNDCLYLIVKCSNQGCPVECLRLDYQKHLSDCPYQLISCPNNCDNNEFKKKRY